ncbi:uncharacterized protein FYW49_009009 [Xenentodon cancila]
MGEFYFYNTSRDEIPNITDINENTSYMNNTGYSSDEISFYYFIQVLQWIIVCIGLPLTLMAIFAVGTLIKADHTAPIYVINLLFSDLIQLCCLAALNTDIVDDEDITYITYIFAVMASVGFMVCISLERRMEENFPDPSSQDNNWKFVSKDYSYGCHWGQPAYMFYVVTMTIACIGLPLTFVAIFAICSLVRKNHVAPIYVINLLISDLIQLSSMIILGQKLNGRTVCLAVNYTHHFGVSVSICFMVVISLERYVVIAWPLWYRFKQNIKTSVIVCMVVWLLPILYLPIFFFAHYYINMIIACFLLLPFPLLIFFLGGTLKALSAARSVPPDEKRRIVAVLVLVLLIYILLFLPRVISSLSEKIRQNPNYEVVTLLPLFFSPLADLFLYVFLRKGICDKFLASLCCCKMDHDDGTSTDSNQSSKLTDLNDTPKQDDEATNIVKAT